jgi:hypothetical protein
MALSVGELYMFVCVWPAVLAVLCYCFRPLFLVLSFTYLCALPGFLWYNVCILRFKESDSRAIYKQRRRTVLTIGCKWVPPNTFYAHGSVHRESTIKCSNKMTLFVQYFIPYKQLYMFRVNVSLETCRTDRPQHLFKPLLPTTDKMEHWNATTNNN